MDTEIRSIEQIHQYINREIESIPFSGCPSNLYDPIAYIMHQNGKRLRPVLALIACNMLGGDLNKIVRPAIGIEIFHNFTLVHDDIMDQSPIRRNHKTVYKKWGTNIAILAGDTMFALAYEFLVQTDEDILGEIIRLFNKTAIEVCEGQQLDIEFENRIDVSIDDYIEMIRKKTAVLLGTSLMTGAIVARASKEQAERLYKIGIMMGLAFQLMDDILDVYAQQDKFGKSIGNDILTNKRTYLFLQAYHKANPSQRRELDECFGNHSIPADEKISRVKHIYDDLKVDDDGYAMADRYYNEALRLLNELPVDNYRKIQLKSLIERLTVREV